MAIPQISHLGWYNAPLPGPTKQGGSPKDKHMQLTIKLAPPPAMTYQDTVDLKKKLNLQLYNQVRTLFLVADAARTSLGLVHVEFGNVPWDESGNNPDGICYYYDMTSGHMLQLAHFQTLYPKQFQLDAALGTDQMEPTVKFQPVAHLNVNDFHQFEYLSIRALGSLIAGLKLFTEHLLDHMTAQTIDANDGKIEAPTDKPSPGFPPSEDTMAIFGSCVRGGSEGVIVVDKLKQGILTPLMAVGADTTIPCQPNP